MKRKTINARLWFLRGLTLLVALSFSIGNLFAQITVTTTVPTGQSGALNVGVGTASFSVSITNTGSSSTHITSLIVNQPVGVSLVSATASIGTATINGDTVLLDTIIPANHKLVVQYLKKASCSAVPNATKDFFVNVRDNITITSSDGVTNALTDTYPILFPGLQVKTPSSVNNGNVKAVLWQLPFTDAITVANASSAGKVMNMLFSMKWAIAGALQISSMSLSKAGGAAIPITTIITQGDSATISIDSTIFAQMGFAGGILNPADSFKVSITATPKKYFAKLETIYSSFAQAEGITCQKLSNASGIMDYTQLLPNLNITLTKTNVKLANWCGKKFEADYILTNASTNIPSNNLLNCFLSFNAYCIIDSVRVGNQYLINKSGKWYLPAANLDGDAIVSDFAPNATSTIHVVATPIISSDYAMNNPSLGVSVNGIGIDGVSGNFTGNYSGGYFTNIHSNISSPPDKNEGESIDYTYTYSAQSSNLSQSTSNAFLDIVDAPIVSDAGIIVDHAPIANSAIDYTSYFSLTAACAMSQKVSLKLQTGGGCATLSTLASAVGNTKIQCSGTGGDCYGIFTDSVSIGGANPIINTCQNIMINAPGHVDHWCHNSK